MFPNDSVIECGTCAHCSGFACLCTFSFSLVNPGVPCVEVFLWRNLDHPIGTGQRMGSNHMLIQL